MDKEDQEDRMPMLIPMGHMSDGDPSVFGVTAEQLVDMVDRKDLDFLDQLGGVDGLARALHSHPTRGLSSTDCGMIGPVNTADPDKEDRGCERIEAFGTNVLPTVEQASLWQLMWIAFQDKTLILLVIAAAVSLSVGLYQDLTTIEYDSSGNRVPGVKWVEGVAILVAVVLVVVVGSLNDHNKESQFRKLNAKKDDRLVNGIRDGVSCVLSIATVQVGDILRLEPGDILPTDGIFVQGHHLKCDESGATGESDAIHKTAHRASLGWSTQPFSMSCSSSSSDTQTLVCSTEEKEVWLDDSTSVASLTSTHPDPFLISGSKVLEGMCTYMVTAVGPHSFHGRTLLAMQVKNETTPLQEKLDGLAGQIATLGSLAAGYWLSDEPLDPTQVVSQVMRILVTAVTVVVVAVPEGLPLAVTLALAYATRRMLKDNNLVRVLAACETMGNATTICTDKTGTLTQNTMTVVAGTFGAFGFATNPEPASDLCDPSNIGRRLPPSLRLSIQQSVAINSTAFRTTTTDDQTILVGSRTETALLSFATECLDSPPFEIIRSDWPVEHVYPFSSASKLMASLIRVNSSSPMYRLHIKGAPEMLLPHCSHVIDLPMTQEMLAKLHNTQHAYASRSLRTLAIATCDLDSWPGHRPLSDILQENKLHLLGIVGIQDPLRVGVKEAVRACQRAGVCVRMVTGDNIETAKSIAKECGISSVDSVVMEGAQYRQQSDSQRQALLPRLHILARANPEDKRLLVQDLKTIGETVAVTGDGTNDGPALRSADVGFSMGLTGTEVAKEASSIILMDDNFASIVKAISWGRCVNDAVKKFLQFQITVNITAVMLTIISAVLSDEQASVLTAVQLLWVNLIMDTFAALALATDPPTPDLLERLPTSRSSHLIDRRMWKMIMGQAVYQIIVMLSLLYTNVLGLANVPATLQTMVFNTFVFCQIFNQVNCRRIDNKFNVVKNIPNNPFFICIFIISVVGQAMIVQWGGPAFQTVPLDASQWCLSVLIGSFSLVIGVVLRLVPDHLIYIPGRAFYQPISQDHL
ncbi:PMCA-type calcium-translocating P-type ATPase [Phycomyces nitens]|nr:PMCA-type calcium-translocating P-type ATPase [Phycomyces nitens]